VTEIETMKKELDRKEIFARKLQTGVAYHSAQMEHISDAYAGSIDTIEPGVTALTGPSMISTLLSSPVSPETLQQAAYWVNNLVSPVRFAQAFQRLCIGGVQKSIDGIHFPVRNIDICLEIGPHHALRGPIRDILVAQEKTMTYLSTLQRGYSGIDSLLQAIGELWCLGQSPDMMLVNNEGMEAKKNNMVSLTNLPAYPWNHTHSYFHESTVSKNHRLRSGPRSPLLGESAADWNCLEARWRNIIKISEHLWVEDHRVSLWL
jgi:acyl transferase domain-containing protein